MPSFLCILLLRGRLRIAAACLRFLTNEGGCLYEDLRHRGARHHDSQSDNTGALFPVQIG